MASVLAAILARLASCCTLCGRSSAEQCPGHQGLQGGSSETLGVEQAWELGQPSKALGGEQRACL